MLRFILVRHGETYWNQERRIQGGGSNTELSETGKRQAEGLAQLLKEVKVDAIYSSPLKRALDTARVIAGYHHLEVEADPNLKEIEVGEFEGVPLPSLGSTFDEFLIQWRQGDGTEKMPGGESLADLDKRSWAAIQRIAAEHKDGVVVVVSHYFVILTIVCRALGLPLNHVRRLRTNVGGMSILDFEDKSPRLVVFNDTCHLREIV